MKNILVILLLVNVCLAGSLTVEWDCESNPSSYEVYRGTEKLATVTTKQATITLPDSDISSLHVIAVYNSYRTEPSNILHVMPFIPAFSFDINSWTKVSTQYATIPTPIIPDKFFVRSSFPVVNK